MKKIAIIGLLAAIIIACVLSLRYHDKITKERDEAFRERLAGVWLREEDNLPPKVEGPLSVRCTNTVAADGSFIELSWFRHTDRTNTYQRTGTWLVKDGHLIEMIKSSTNPSEVTPHTNAGRIIHSDAREFTLRWPNSVETIWQRVTTSHITAINAAPDLMAFDSIYVNSLHPATNTLVIGGLEHRPNKKRNVDNLE